MFHWPSLLDLKPIQEACTSNTNTLQTSMVLDHLKPLHLNVALILKESMKFYFSSFIWSFTQGGGESCLNTKSQIGLRSSDYEGPSIWFAICVFLLTGSYIPEGLMTSCTWDYVTATPANKSYTLMLCCLVFFVPLGIISYCYVFMFLAIRNTSR